MFGISFREMALASATKFGRGITQPTAFALANEMAKAENDKQFPRLPVFATKRAATAALRANNFGASRNAPGLVRKKQFRGKHIAIVQSNGTEFALHATKGWRRIGKVVN